MESIVFFGKGGIGKSTIASNISVIFAAKGRKVLHVGCDPKGDSTLPLTGCRVKHFADGGTFSGEAALRSSIHPSLFKNINCIESGGPQAGVGCAGAGIGAMLDIMKEFSILEKDGYDAVVFDVLGDVVCGGFAAPLRRGLAGKAVIVVSEEMLSLYAANKLIAMVNNYARNGVWLAGLAVNAKDREAVRLAEIFAAAARTRVLGVIPRDPAVARAEKMHRPVTAVDPGSQAAAAIVRLAAAIEASRPPKIQPRTVGDIEFQELFSCTAVYRGKVRRVSGKRLLPAEIIKKAGFKVAGLSAGQIICAWRCNGGIFNVLIAPASEARDGMTRCGDWAICFAPDQKEESSDFRPELETAALEMSGVCFDDFINLFGGGIDFYGNIGAFDEISSHSLPDRNNRPREQHLGFGQWQRFVFPADGTVCVPPGAVMLEHGDRECRFSESSTTPLSVFKKSGGLAETSKLSLKPLLPKENPVVVNTGFDYSDAVKGDDIKVEASLDAAARMTGPGGLVEFYCTCSSLLLSTDVKAPMERVSAARKVEMLRENFNSFYTGTPAKIRARTEFMARKIKAAGKPRRRFDLNMVDFGTSRAPLSDLLVCAGFSIAPQDGDFYADIVSSKLQLLPSPDPIMRAAFDKLGLKWISPPAPYGMAATKVWLNAVLEAVGKRTRFDSPPSTALYAGLSKKAAGFRAGFVVEAGELSMLDGGESMHGVPVLSFLAEAGFRLGLLAYAPSPAAKVKAQSGFKTLPPAVRCAAGLDFFDSPAGLYKKLAGDRTMRLLYSDMPMDSRAAAAGKTPFSSALFEPGYEGAVETLRRLIGLCGFNFNEKYFSRKSFRQGL